MAPKQVAPPAILAVALYTIIIFAFVVLVKVCEGIVVVPEFWIVSIMPAG